MKPRPLTVLLILLALLAAPLQAAESDWDRNKGECETIFKEYRGRDLPTLKQCLLIWQTYKPASEVTPEERGVLEPFLNHLYFSGDEEAKYYAQMAMDQLKLQPKEPPKQADTPRQFTQDKAPASGPATAKRARYQPREASAAEKKAADALVKKGLADHKKGKYRQAQASYQKALESDPGNVMALYNAACAYSLDGNKADAVEHLSRLVDLGTQEARKKVRQARTDRDFDPIRDELEFKVAVGTARIKVVNGVGEYGEDEIKRITKTLTELGYDAKDEGPDKHDRAYPVVWYKPPFKASAFVVGKAVNHPKTRYQVIDWDSKSDLIVSWGDVIKKNKFGEPIVKSYAPKDPDEANKQMDSLIWEQDQALQQPDNYSRKVDKVASTPDNVEMKAEQSIRRVEDSGKRAKKAMDKVEKLFK
jgi:tetratricopeptide (TPR) repeat protein